MRIPDWITVNEAARTADCAVCRTGTTVQRSMFGRTYAYNLLAAFVVAHATHTKAGQPSGLTSSGWATKAAREVLR